MRCLNMDFKEIYLSTNIFLLIYLIEPGESKSFESLQFI